MGVGLLFLSARSGVRGEPFTPSAPRPPILGEVVDSSPQSWGARGAGSRCGLQPHGSQDHEWCMELCAVENRTYLFGQFVELHPPRRICRTGTWLRQKSLTRAGG